MGDFVRWQFDKNAAADFLSRRLEKLVSGEAVRQLHIRGTCPAAGKTNDGRLFWTRDGLEGYIAMVRSRFSAA